MPNQPKTTIRGFRIADDLYIPALAKARRENRKLSQVIRAALQEYVADEVQDAREEVRLVEGETRDP